jgi:hypothetical protein
MTMKVITFFTIQLNLKSSKKKGFSEQNLQLHFFKNSLSQLIFLKKQATVFISCLNLRMKKR